MKIFLAGASSFSTEVKKSGVERVLYSFFELRNKGDFGTFFRENTVAKDIFIDSSAFTAWSVGRKVDIDAYILFCKELQKIPGYNYTFVNLDVIPGQRGSVPTTQEREFAAEASWENMEYIESKGINVLPVFHQHEDFKWLERLRETHEYIGVSAANDMPLKQRIGWLDTVYYRIRDSIKTHGFGVTTKQIIYRYPYYSVDSTSWLDCKKFGHSLTCSLKAKGLSRKLGQPISGNHGKIMLLELVDELKRWRELERTATELWARRGVIWNESNIQKCPMDTAIVGAAILPHCSSTLVREITQ